MNKKRNLDLNKGSRSQKSVAKGERRAVLYLILHGYRIVERNYLLGHKEIDIIAKKGNTYAFIEVKSRRGAAIAPMFSVNAAKKRNVASAAAMYAAKNGLRKQVLRFDIIEVDLSRKWPLNGVNHIENAFE